MDDPAGENAPEAAEQIGFLLAAARRAAGLKQEDLAAAAGVSIRTIQGIEGARGRIPHASTIRLICRALGLSESERDRLLAAASAARVRPELPTPTLPGGDALPGLPPILGRDADIAAFESALADGCSLLTLLGPGGVGKTRLAREIAARRLRAGRHVFWVPLDAIVSPDLVLPAIARAADVPEVGPDPLVARVAAALAPLRPLIVIDNAEHLLSAAPDLAALFRALPAAQFLVTSREHLRLAGERIAAVAPLGLPDLLASPDALAINPAVALLTRTLAAVAPERAAGADLAAAAAIVRLLDGLPLAIELAAAQGVTLPLPFIASLLETRGLDALARGPRDAPARFQTMQAAIGWSADLLPEPGQRLVRVLGAFRGGFATEGVMAVASALGESGLVAALPMLADVQLVQPDPNRPGRLRMLEPIRMFAEERLRAAGDEPAVRRAHAAAYLRWAREQAGLVSGPNPLPALDAIDADLANVLAALAYASGDPACDVEETLRAVADLGQYWEIRDRLREGRSAVAAAIAAAIAAAGPGAPPGVPLMEALFSAGYLAYIQMDIPEVELAIERLRPLAEAASAPEYLARVEILRILRDISTGGALEDALRGIQAVHASASDTPDGRSWFISLIMTANLMVECGDHEGALPLFQAYLAWANRKSNAIHARSANVWAGLALLHLERWEEARRELIASLADSGSGRVVPLQQWTVLGLAVAESNLGADAHTLRRAARLHGVFDALLQQLGFPVAPLQARLRDQSRQLLAEELGQRNFDALVAEGRGLGLDETLALING